MKIIALLFLALRPAVGGLAQEASSVRRDTLEIKVLITGTVVADEVFQLKSSIEGRVEAILASTGAWVSSKKDLALLAPRELTALIDAQGTARKEMLEDRWKRVWQPTPIFCPEDCFLLKSFASPKDWVKPGTTLFEAARSLRLVGRVKAEDAHWIADGQELEFWPVNDPKMKSTVRVSRYVIVTRQGKTVTGGIFSIKLSPKLWLPPGTPWEAMAVPLVKKNVLLAPTAALIRMGPDVFLPVRVSTGVTTPTITEIKEGVEENRKILILGDEALKGASRHKQEVDVETLLKSRWERASAASSPTTKKELSELSDPDAAPGNEPENE